MVQAPVPKLKQVKSAHSLRSHLELKALLRSAPQLWDLKLRPRRWRCRLNISTSASYIDRRCDVARCDLKKLVLRRSCLQVIFELVHTEATYVTDLHIIVEDLLHPLQALGDLVMPGMPLT